MKTKFLALFLALTTVGTIFASDIVINKIWYNLDDGTKTAAVTFKGETAGDRDDRYTGAVRIPATVSYQGKTYDVVSIGDEAFADCRNLTSVTLPNSITSIGNSAFSRCFTLNKINIPESVTNIGQYAFNACISLMNLTIPSTVTTIGTNAFSHIPNLIYDGADFYGARGWNSYVEGNLVYASDAKTELLACSFAAKGKIKLPSTLIKIHEYAFFYCANLDALTLPDNLVFIGSHAFYGCTAMLSLNVPNNVASIESSAFYDVPNVIYKGGLTSSDNWGAKSLNGYVDGNLVYEDEEHTILKAANSKITGNLNLPNTVKTIGERAFASQFSKTTSVMMGSSVETLGSNCFRNCIITSVVIPATVKTIEKQAFQGCIFIKSFICEASTPPTIGSSILSLSRQDGELRPRHRICVPANSVDQYKAQWISSYKDSIFAITAETSVIGSEDIAVTAEDVTALVKWPKLDGDGYLLEIKDKDDVIKFMYSFDGEGVLLNTAFGAPGLGGPRGSAQNLEAAMKCWQYKIEGLEPNSKYTVHVVSEKAGETIFDKTKSFTTKKRQAIDQINGQSQMTNVKYIEDGKLFIRRGDKTYTVSGQVIE